jgi:hypothetical protein
MNRAWIPAGALAGVSVAGLLAMGPLTDSMNTPVSFPPPVKVVGLFNAAKQSSSKPVSLVLNVKQAVGNTETAALKTTRGGQASALTTSSSEGQVALKLHSQVSTHTATAVTHSTTTHAATPPATPKKVVKRLQSIGTVGETNSDSGFASGSGGKTSTGESSPTPSSSGS